MRLTILIIFQALLFTSGCASDKETRPKKKINILFAFADDWGRHASAYAKLNPGGVNDLIKTPNFDAVAKRGILFKNAFVNSPSCTPCRSSLLSGQHFWRTGRGAILQGAVWDTKIPSYPLLLKDKAQYHIGKSYKVWSPGKNTDAPYGGKTFAYQRAGQKMNGFSFVAERLVKQGKTVDEAKKHIMNEVRENFKDFLKKRKPNQPFCYWFGPTNVHRKWVQGSGKKLWNLDPDKLKGKMPPFLPDVHTVREDLADYFGEAMAFDMALGILIDELKAAGELENTLIVISGDHGAPGFPHGKCNLYDFGSGVALAAAGPGIKGNRVVEDFVSLPDLAPTFLEAGGVTPPKVMTGKSLWPVFQSSKSGLTDEKRDAVFIGRERHVAIARAKNLPYPQRAIRTQDFLFVINFKPDRYPLGDPYNLGTDKEASYKQMTSNTFVTLPDEDAGPTKAWIVSNRHKKEWAFYFNHAYSKRPMYELYDMKKDPHQMKNVASDPSYSKVVEALKKRLMNELRTTGDPRLVDDGRFFETPPMAGPYQRPKRKKKK